MRFMMIVKSAERSGLPPKEFMEAIAKLTEEASKTGTMIGERWTWPHRAGISGPAFRREDHRERRAFHRSQGDYRRVRAV